MRVFLVFFKLICLIYILSSCISLKINCSTGTINDQLKQHDLDITFYYPQEPETSELFSICEMKKDKFAIVAAELEKHFKNVTYQKVVYANTLKPRCAKIWKKEPGKQEIDSKCGFVKGWDLQNGKDSTNCQQYLPKSAGGYSLHAAKVFYRRFKLNEWSKNAEKHIRLMVVFADKRPKINYNDTEAHSIMYEKPYEFNMADLRNVTDDAKAKILIFSTEAQLDFWYKLYVMAPDSVSVQRFTYNYVGHIITYAKSLLVNNAKAFDEAIETYIPRPIFKDKNFNFHAETIIGLSAIHYNEKRKYLYVPFYEDMKLLRNAFVKIMISQFDNTKLVVANEFNTLKLVYKYYETPWLTSLFNVLIQNDTEAFQPKCFDSKYIDELNSTVHFYERRLFYMFNMGYDAYELEHLHPSQCNIDKNDYDTFLKKSQALGVIQVVKSLEPTPQTPITSMDEKFVTQPHGLINVTLPLGMTTIKGLVQTMHRHMTVADYARPFDPDYGPFKSHVKKWYQNEIVILVVFAPMSFQTHLYTHFLRAIQHSMESLKTGLAKRHTRRTFYLGFGQYSNYDETPNNSTCLIETRPAISPDLQKINIKINYESTDGFTRSDAPLLFMKNCLLSDKTVPLIKETLPGKIFVLFSETVPTLNDYVNSANNKMYTNITTFAEFYKILEKENAHLIVVTLPHLANVWKKEASYLGGGGRIHIIPVYRYSNVVERIAYEVRGIAN